MCPTDTGDAEFDAVEVQRRLGLSPDAAAWLGHIERPANAPGPVLPADSEAVELLECLGVAAGDRMETLAARPDPTRQPALWWTLDRLFHDMLANMGRPAPISGFPGWPAMPMSTGPVGRHLYVWLFLAMVPSIRRYHTEHAVPDDVSWASLAKLGDQMAKDRDMYGASGLDGQWALPLIFRGGFYSGLGRLNYDRQFSPVDFASAPGTGRPPRRGEPVVNVHIPGNGLPLDPIACDESIERARDFFTRHFPEQPVAFVCHTWILDEQLADYLPENSNIIRFQRRFHRIPHPEERADRSMLRLIFRRDPQDWPVLPPDVLEELPQETTLQRAFVTHLRAGHHWFNRDGWFALDACDERPGSSPQPFPSR